MRYYIVYNIDKIVFHYGTLLDDQFLSTGLEQTFITEDKQEFIDKLKNEFDIDYVEDIQGIVHNYIEDYIQQLINNTINNG